MVRTTSDYAAAGIGFTLLVRYTITFQTSLSGDATRRILK
jgi:hypothetical protein